MKTPEEITEELWAKSFKFLEKPVGSLIVGGLIAGILVGIAVITTVTATSDMEKYFGLGFTRLVSGIVFTFGLITIVLSGSDLFTGSNLFLVSICKDKKCFLPLLKNSGIIYFANFMASLFLIFMIWGSGIFEIEMIKDSFIRITDAKLSLTWGQAFIRGVLCNFLVCLAIRVGEASKEISGKILAYVFVIGAFVINAFEHSVANMFFIPTGILLKGQIFDFFSWKNFFINNLLPVTLGNIIGGGLLIGYSYYFLHRTSFKDIEVQRKVGVKE